jgi:hypothetical protein
MAKILKDIKRGAPKKIAAEANGICEAHFYDAIKQGLTDLKFGERETRWAKLAESLRSIEMDEIISCKEDIRHSQRGHHGAEWTLEKVYWRHFCGDAKILELAKQVDELTGAAHEKE